MNAARLIIAAGCREAEHLAVRRVLDLAGEVRSDPWLLAKPVRIVVPSISLRNHFETALLRQAERGVVGVEVQTLSAVASEIATRSGSSVRRPSAVADVLVQRFARQENVLRRALDGLVDGYASVAASVRDLFDAGFESVHWDAVDEALASDGRSRGTVQQVERARAVTRVAAAVQAAEEAIGLESHSAFLRSVRDLLATEDPEELLPSRALLLHGFAQPTGVTADFLEELARSLGGEVYFSRPTPRRLVERLSRFAEVCEEEVELERQAIDFFVGPDPSAELREIARRARKEIDDRAIPEAIGVVLANPSEQVLPLRRQFRKLGIPFSGVGLAGPPRPSGRRLVFLVELLREGDAMPVDRWLDDTREDEEDGAELRRALVKAGVRRLRDFVDLETFPRSPSFSEVLRSGRSLALALRRWRGDEDERETFRNHVDRLKQVLDEHLGWVRDEPARVALLRILRDLDVPADLNLTYDEMLAVVRDALRREDTEPLGGRGGGVQVLTIQEAAGRTFERLFICGLNRHALPRPAREDPLLRDGLREILGRLLPDLPRRAENLEDERALFDQLLTSSPGITLSWPTEDERGRPLRASSFAEACQRQLGAEAVRVPGVLAVGLESIIQGDVTQGDVVEEDLERPVDEQLLWYALQGDRKAFARVLPAAFEESFGLLSEPPQVSASVLARARMAVLNEMDPDRSTREGRRRSVEPGPYHGFLGPVTLEEDRRRGEIFVTTLESLAACPWQTFLTRVLRVRPPAGRLTALPPLRGLLVGRVVHRVLERIALDIQQGGDWPTDLDDVLVDEATVVLAEDGLSMEGLVQAAAEQSRPFVEVAERLDFTGAFEIAGVESEASIEVMDAQGTPRTIRFRSDRQDARAGGPCHTDYKTGARPRISGSSDSWRKAIARGQLLQVPAYAQGGPGHVGRYIYLRPDLEDEERVLAVRGDDRAIRDSFQETVRTLLRAWDEGIFVPRLVMPDEDVEPLRCQTCEVAEACLRRDSGSRVRLRRIAERLSNEDDGEMATFRDIWRLPVLE